MFPVEFRARRQIVGASKNQMAGLLGVPRQTIVNWEQYGPPPEETERIKTALFEVWSWRNKFHDEILDQIVLDMRDNEPSSTDLIKIETYASNHAFWEAHPDAYDHDCHVWMHQAAAAEAAFTAELEWGCETQIVFAPLR